MCKPVDSCGAQFSRICATPKRVTSGGCLRWNHQSRPSQWLMVFHWVSRLGVAGFSLVHTGTGRYIKHWQKIAGCHDFRSWPNWGGVSKFDPCHIIILPCVSSSQDHRAQLGISPPDIPRPRTCEAHDRVCRLRWPSIAPGVKTVHDQLCFPQKVSDLTKNWMIEMIEV